MATVYSDYYTTGTYTKTRVRVDYSGTSATATLLYTRTNSYYTQAGTATFTFGGQSVSFTGFSDTGPSYDKVVCSVNFTIASSGGTYSGSTSGSPGLFAFSGSVFIPSQGTAPSNGSITGLSTYWDHGANCACVKASSVSINDGGLSLTIFNLLGSNAPYTDSGYPSHNRIAVNCTNGLGQVLSDSNNSATDTTGYTMQANALVYTGIYAQNSVGAYRLKTADGAPTIITAPAPFDILPPTLTSTTAEFHVYTSDDGGYYDKTLQYRLNGGSWIDWTVVQDMLSDDIVLDITGLTPDTWYTLECQVVTTAGTTACNTLHFATPPDQNLYGSVSNAAARVNKLYGSVGGHASQVYKLYGSVNGVAKPVFIRHVHE